MHIQVTQSSCTGCRLCRQICAIERFGVTNPRKALLRVEARFPEPGTYHPQVCDQCGKCAEVCPTECITKDERGVYMLDRDNCTMCGACLAECPLEVMVSDDDDVPLKCDLCLRCTEVCNTGALVFVD